MNAYKRTNGPHRAPRAESSKVCPKEQDSNHLERAACKENMSKLAPLSFVQRHLQTVSPWLSLEETKERKRSATNKQQKPGSQGDGPHSMAWISRPCANLQILTSFVVSLRALGTLVSPGSSPCLGSNGMLSAYELSQSEINSTGQRTVTALPLPTWRIDFWDLTNNHSQRCRWSPFLSPELGRHGV